MLFRQHKRELCILVPPKQQQHLKLKPKQTNYRETEEENMNVFFCVYFVNIISLNLTRKVNKNY